MKYAKLALAGMVLLVVGACATAKTWSATGGSRADGTVRLSYEVGMLEVPTIDEAQGIELAKQRCAVWGYSGAEAFGGTTSVCNAPSTSGCMSTLVTKEYQCTGTGTPGGRAEINIGRTPYTAG